VVTFPQVSPSELCIVALGYVIYMLLSGRESLVVSVCLTIRTSLAARKIT